MQECRTVKCKQESLQSKINEFLADGWIYEGFQEVTDIGGGKILIVVFLKDKQEKS